jgi:hypothetical protein
MPRVQGYRHRTQCLHAEHAGNSRYRAYATVVLAATTTGIAHIVVFR